MLMDTARVAIVARVAELGLSLSELSLKVGRNHAYFQQFIKRGVPNRLPEEVRGRVAEILGIDERILKEPSSPPAIFRMTAEHRNLSNLTRGTAWIPVYGHAMGGKDGEFILSGNQVSEVLAPPNLSHVPDAYAVYVVGDSMEPRYFAGETVFVNPRLPISRGAFVVAQILKGQEAEPRAYVKRFVSQDTKRLRLEQYNPKKILEFPISTVGEIHRIVMSGENR
jgi:phage repressor protein C with HTH and peptisase S24 domain